MNKMTDAKEYGKALFLVAEEDGAAEAVAEAVSTLRHIFKENPEYLRLLDTPALTREEKHSLIDEALSSLDSRAINLVKILSDARMCYLYDKVFTTFNAMYDDYRGIERVEAVTAVALTEAQTRALAAKVQELTGKRAIIKNTVDKEILGGVKLRFDGKQLDGSVKGRLDKFEAALKDTVI